jgi:hypothetical protein
MISTEQHLEVLTAEVLRDLGRNEAAGWAVRKAAVKMLIDRKHAFANHPDFRELRLELKEESEAHAEVESLIGQVEEKVQEMDKTLDPESDDFVHEPDNAVGPDARPGPFKAGFTTRNM